MLWLHTHTHAFGSFASITFEFVSSKETKKPLAMQNNANEFIPTIAAYYIPYHNRLQFESAVEIYGFFF